MAIFVTKAEDVKVFETYNMPPSAQEGPSTSSSSPVVGEPAQAQPAVKPPKFQSSVSYDALNTANSNDNDGRVKASPLAKKIAAETGVSLSSIGVGSGPDGRIIKSDVLAATATANAKPAVRAPASKATAAPASARPFEDVPHSTMRKIIATRLTESKQNIPHYYLRVDIRMDKILALRAKFNSTPELQETFGSFKLSVNDFIVKAAALALNQVPAVNSAWYDDCIREYKCVDVSVAVATPSGLITPIIFDADQKGLVAISNSIKELAARAKEIKLKPEEFQVSLHAQPIL